MTYAVRVDPDKYDTLISNLKQKSTFIGEKLEEKLIKDSSAETEETVEQLVPALLSIKKEQIESMTEEEVEKLKEQHSADKISIIQNWPDKPMPDHEKEYMKKQIREELFGIY